MKDGGGAAATGSMVSFQQIMSSFSNCTKSVFSTASTFAVVKAKRPVRGNRRYPCLSLNQGNLVNLTILFVCELLVG